MRARTIVFALVCGTATAALAQDSGYVRFPSPSSNACATACAGDQMCASWSYGSAARSYGQSQTRASQGGMCTFSGSSTLRNSPGVVTGLPRRAESSPNVPLMSAPPAQSGQSYNSRNYASASVGQSAMNGSGASGWGVRAAPWLSGVSGQQQVAPAPQQQRGAPQQLAVVAAIPDPPSAPRIEFEAPSQPRPPQYYPPPVQVQIPQRQPAPPPSPPTAAAPLPAVQVAPTLALPLRREPLAVPAPPPRTQAMSSDVGAAPATRASIMLPSRPSARPTAAAAPVSTPDVTPPVMEVSARPAIRRAGRGTPKARAPRVAVSGANAISSEVIEVPVQAAAAITAPLMVPATAPVAGPSPRQVVSPTSPPMVAQSETAVRVPLPVPLSVPVARRAASGTPRPPAARAPVASPPAITPPAIANARANAQANTQANDQTRPTGAAPPRQEAIVRPSSARGSGTASGRAPVRDPNNPESFRGADGMIDSAEMRRAQLNAAREQGRPAYSVQREWEAVAAERQRADAAGEVRPDLLAGTRPVPPPPETRAQKRAREAEEALVAAQEERDAARANGDVEPDVAPPPERRPASRAGRGTPRAKPPRQTSQSDNTQQIAQTAPPRRTRQTSRAPAQALDREPRLSGGPG